MNFKRQETNIQKEHPVRFYKITALTFLFITILLFIIVALMSSKRATITALTKTEPIPVSGTVYVGGEERPGRIGGQVVTTTIKLSKIFKPTGTKEETGNSHGTITVRNETSHDQPLVVKTRFLSEESVLFRLTKGIVVPANGDVDAQVYADEDGPSGDIDPSKFTIPGLSESKQKLIYGVSDEAMTGGKRIVGILSEDDIAKAEDVLKDEIKAKGEESVLSQYGDFSGILELRSVAFKSDKETGAEISEFTLTGSADAIGVLYKQEEMTGYANRILQARAVDSTSTITSASTPPVMTFVEYDKEKQSAILDFAHSGFATISPEGRHLDKLMFYGKTKEEIRRYLLSLKYVYGVEVEFRPVWIRTVPHVADHVTIIVKNVE